ncbi:MAG: exodeoxyribonuclease VII large subunit [Bryobacteraceae bacterium]
MEQFALEFDLTPERRIFSVSELNAAIRAILDDEFRDIWVSGEISGLKLASSGHYYFTLKERDAQLKCVAFRSAHRYWKFKPADGLAVLARGRIDVYEVRGEYQLQVELLEPQGLGALQLAFEQLKKKLAAEGLFAAERKRRLPRFPRRIGIVTSPRGAAIADMIHILSRRFSGLAIRLFPALVQGPGSVEEVCRGIEYFSRSGWPEVVIVGRGGGSLEDLWTFNEEAVARAIAACSVPVISAVGHETDVTIADFVADLRAPTPSAAAELVVPTRVSVHDRITAAEGKALQAVRYRLAMLDRRLRQQGVDRALGVLHRRVGRGLQRVDEQEYRLRERLRSMFDARERASRTLEARLRHFDVRPRLATGRRRLEAAQSLAVESIHRRLARRRSAFDQLHTQLHALGPLKVLERGYAIVSNESGIVKDSAAAPPASRIHIRLAKGELDAAVGE